MTTELMPKQLFLAVSSRSVRWQMEKLGCRWWNLLSTKIRMSSDTTHSHYYLINRDYLI